MSLPSRQSSIQGGAVVVRGPRPTVAPAPKARRERNKRLPLAVSGPIIVTASLALWAGIVTAVGKLVGWL